MTIRMAAPMRIACASYTEPDTAFQTGLTSETDAEAIRGHNGQDRVT